MISEGCEDGGDVGHGECSSIGDYEYENGWGNWELSD